MTPATDDDALEAAFEALLAGQRAPAAADGLMAFADGVRATAARPPRPSGALAELLATGLLTDQSSVPAAPAATHSRRRSARMIPQTLIAKVLSLGAVAKAAAATGVVAVGVVTAGAADTLPTPAQHAFATVVSHVTPFHAPDDVEKDDDGGTTTTTPTTGTTGTTVATTGTTGSGGATDATSTSTTTGTGTTDSSTAGTATTATGDDPADPSRPANFGSQVSSRAQSTEKGDHFGQSVSSAAHNNHSFDGKPADPSPTSTGGTATTPSEGSGTATSGTTPGTDNTTTSDTQSGDAAPAAKPSTGHGHR